MGDEDEVADDPEINSDAKTSLGNGEGQNIPKDDIENQSFDSTNNVEEGFIEPEDEDTEVNGRVENKLADSTDKLEADSEFEVSLDNEDESNEQTEEDIEIEQVEIEEEEEEKLNEGEETVIEQQSEEEAPINDDEES